ncbi:MAG: Hsp20/alpha crystallin family protein [Candidatus Omnitrophica bacterium]|nr:Hsp20/alpha crystallin family protein [Candidatus Omnitrophota bacterium]
MKSKILTLLMVTAVFAGIGAITSFAQDEKQYIVGKVVALDAEGNKVTVKDMNTGERKTFTFAADKMLSLGLGEDVVVTVPKGGTGIDSIKSMQDRPIPNRPPEPNANVARDPYGIPDPTMNEVDPFAEMTQLQRKMNQLFNTTIDRNMGYTKTGLGMNVGFNDIHETDKGYSVEIEAPGMDKNSMNVEVKGNMLVVSGKKEAQQEDKKQGGIQKQYSYGSFSRAMTIPEDADMTKMDVKYDNGVLKIQFPKKAPAKK